MIYTNGLSSDAAPRLLGIIIFLFSVGVFLDVLEAYTAAAIPLPWIASFVYLLALFAIAFLTGRIPLPSGTLLLLFYLFWSLFALSIYLALNGAPAMPALATTPYPVYLALRVMTVVVFFAVAATCYWLVRRGALEQIIRIQLALLLFVSLSALYVYAAQTLGFWEPPRNRMGTGGQDFITEGIHFTYAFHRALGTFREPSHLAEWLVGTLVFLLPVMAIYIRVAFRVAIIFLTLIVIALTGSLLGVLCLAAGLLALLFFQKGFRLLLNVAAFLLLVSIVVTVAYRTLGVDAVGVLAPRFAELIEGGIGATNRAYIYENLSDVPLTFMGYGLGTAPLLTAAVKGSDLVVAILNLFLSVTYDAGLIGLVCVVIYFSLPFVLATRYGITRSPVVVGCLASHVSWMVAYLGRASELSPSHAVPFGVMMACFYLASKSGPHKKRIA